MVNFEVFSSTLLDARKHDHKYTTIRAKLAISRLICHIVQSTNEGKLSLLPWDTAVQWNGDAWRCKTTKGIFPVSLFARESCIADYEHALSARIGLGLRVRQSFISGFVGNSRCPDSTRESRLFFAIGAIVHCKLRGLTCRFGVPAELNAYIDEQWQNLYVSRFGNRVQF